MRKSAFFILVFICSILIQSSHVSAEFSPTLRVNTNSPSWGYTESSNFMSLGITVIGGGNSSVVGHNLQIAPYICSTEDIFGTCELDYLSLQNFVLPSSNATVNLSLTIPGYYRNANFIYFYIYDTQTDIGDFARDVFSNFDHGYINYVGSRLPVYRLYNYKQGAHFYSNNYVERKNIIDNSSSIFRDEGVAFFADTSNVGGTLPVHRFYNFKQGVHFYTINQNEATNVNNNLFTTFRYEGIAYYANP